MLVLAQGAWAQKTIKLDPEPPGERSGIARPTSDPAQSIDEDGKPFAPFRLVVVGDSMVAGCGVDSQEEALTPRIAQRMSERSGRPTLWRTHARLGATIRRVRHRFIPEVTGEVDLLLICVGSNDVMTRRCVEEWDEDLRTVLAQASLRARQVVMISPGQPHKSPRLPKTLRSVLAERIDEQVARSMATCAELGVPYLNLAHTELVPEFWANDGFHPGAVGYDFIAEAIVEALSGILSDARLAS